MVESNSRKMNNFGVSDSYRYCIQCHRILPKDSDSDYCSACAEMNLFKEVRDFIRANDVNEDDVAEYFGLSKMQVRQWIREGRIQYKGHDGKFTSLFCNICGKPIDSDTICPDCRKYEKLKVVAKARSMDNSRMRYLDKDNL